MFVKLIANKNTLDDIVEMLKKIIKCDIFLGHTVENKANQYCRKNVSDPKTTNAAKQDKRHSLAHYG